MLPYDFFILLARLGTALFCTRLCFIISILFSTLFFCICVIRFFLFFFIHWEKSIFPRFSLFFLPFLLRILSGSFILFKTRMTFIWLTAWLQSNIHSIPSIYTCFYGLNRFAIFRFLIQLLLSKKRRTTYQLLAKVDELILQVRLHWIYAFTFTSSLLYDSCKLRVLFKIKSK